jgi:ABC-2 type transport system ATP-binding protein
MTNQTSNAVSIESLSAGYGGKIVVHEVSLNIAKGKTFGVIGLNGAGKTTIIKTLLGLKDSMGGQMKILDLAIDDPSVKQEIAYLPERFDPPWFLKGDEFVEFSAKLYNRTIRREDIVTLAEKLSLDTNALSRRVQTYSKGMRQKLGLIATVLTGCQVLILDEPMSGLDPLARVLVKEMLMSLEGQGRTIILSSHILADMDEICDRICVIHEGVLRFEGTPKALKEQSNVDSLEQAFLHIVRNTNNITATKVA